MPCLESAALAKEKEKKIDLEMDKLKTHGEFDLMSLSFAAYNYPHTHREGIRHD